MVSELGLERHKLWCQLADGVFHGHAGELAWGLQGLSFLLLSGHVQGWEHTRCPGACRALMYLQGVTQGEWIPAECLGRNEKKAVFSFCSSPAIYSGPKNHCNVCHFSLVELIAPWKQTPKFVKNLKMYINIPSKDLPIM